MDNAAVLSVDELLALNSHLRQQAKQDAVMNIALQLQLRENDETISMLRHSCSAAAKSAPVMEGQRCTCASKGKKNSPTDSAPQGRGQTYSAIEHFINLTELSSYYRERNSVQRTDDTRIKPHCELVKFNS